MRVALLFTRLPFGEMHGRKVVLRSVVEALVDLGHDVDLLVISATSDEDVPSSFLGRTAFLKVPSLAQVAWNVLTRSLMRGWSLNECLYWSGGVARSVRRQVADWGSDMVVADMIRMAPIAERCGVPALYHLDDMLSQRYATIAADPAQGELLLGYYAEAIPRPLRALAESFARKALRYEERRLRAREVYHCRVAPHAAVVSSVEARLLSEASGREVSDLPMTVPLATISADAAHRPLSFVFLGGLKLQGNLAALRWFRDHVVPPLGASSTRCAVTIIGSAPEHLRAEFPTPTFHFQGYVPDVFEELSRHQVLLAPIRGGTGIKTKVLEAMAVGLIVVTTPDGIAGLSVEDGRECYVADTPAEWVDALRRVADRPSEAAAIAARGREYVREHFSPGVLHSRWATALQIVNAKYEPSSQGDLNE